MFVDIPALVAHISDVLEFVVQNSDYLEKNMLERNDIHQKQEIIVYYYLCGLLTALSHMDENRYPIGMVCYWCCFCSIFCIYVLCRVMPFLREKGVFMSGVRALVRYTSYDRCCEALSLLVDTEDYSSYTTQYISPKDRNDVAELVKLQAFVSANFQTESKHRDAMRPLLDAIAKVKRQSNRK